MLWVSQTRSETAGLEQSSCIKFKLFFYYNLKEAYSLSVYALYFKDVKVTFVIIRRAEGEKYYEYYKSSKEDTL